MRVGKKHSCCETVSTLDRFYRCVSLACQLGSSEDIEVVEKARFVCFEDGHLVFTNLSTSAVVLVWVAATWFSLSCFNSS